MEVCEIDGGRVRGTDDHVLERSIENHVLARIAVEQMIRFLSNGIFCGELDPDLGFGIAKPFRVIGENRPIHWQLVNKLPGESEKGALPIFHGKRHHPTQTQRLVDDARSKTLNPAIHQWSCAFTADPESQQWRPTSSLSLDDDFFAKLYTRFGCRHSFKDNLGREKKNKKQKKSINI